MNIALRINTQEEIIVLLIVLMVIFRTILGVKLRRLGKVSNVKYAVKMFMISDFGIITLIILYIITAALNLSFQVTMVLVTVFIILFFLAYKKT